MKQRIFILFTLVAVLGIGVILSENIKAGDETHYAFNVTVVSTSDGSFISTSPLQLKTQSELKAAAAELSDPYEHPGETVLIGSGGDEENPITDIQIVGISGVAYGNVVRCVSEE